MNQSILILLFFLSGCSFLGNDNDDITSENILFQTDQREYVASLESSDSWPRYTFTVIAHFKNNSDQTIYLDRCYGDSPQPIYSVNLMNKESSERSAYNGAWACVGHNNPIAVKSGAVRTDTLQITGPNSRSNEDNGIDDILEGSFRIKYQMQTCRNTDGEDCTLPDSLSYSNEFKVQLAE